MFTLNKEKLVSGVVCRVDTVDYFEQNRSDFIYRMPLRTTTNTQSGSTAGKSDGRTLTMDLCRESGQIIGHRSNSQRCKMLAITIGLFARGLVFRTVHY